MKTDNKRWPDGEKIKLLREEFGLTQKKLAEKTGLKIRTIFNLEKERNSISIDSLNKLADVFKVDRVELLKSSNTHESRMDSGMKTRKPVIQLVWIPGRKNPLRLRYRPRRPIDDLLREIDEALTEEVEAFSYGKQWYLTVTDTGYVFESLGSAFTKAETVDQRTYEQVGIQPEMNFTVRLGPIPTNP